MHAGRGIGAWAREAASPVHEGHTQARARRFLQRHERPSIPVLSRAYLCIPLPSSAYWCIPVRTVA
eukprot:357985-Chlamydomonas_euryale.AAC.1